MPRLRKSVHTASQNAGPFVFRDPHAQHFFLAFHRHPQRQVKRLLQDALVFSHGCRTKQST